MANHQVDPLNGNVSVVDKRRGGPSTGNSAASIATPANYASISAMRTRLTAISAGTYTAARLDAMTQNDMVYALRLNDDLAGV